ncbi:unnamed protein product [Polarella glacialis]|uniref:Uncharacterized protein n=1 Tax=Polarella glacialis TaxID=89957 RepID=A0A813K9B8_POLGL|nr:unnamed protein product [Polarella glacialis]
MFGNRSRAALPLSMYPTSSCYFRRVPHKLVPFLPLRLSASPVIEFPVQLYAHPFVTVVSGVNTMSETGKQPKPSQHAFFTPAVKAKLFRARIANGIELIATE